MTDENYKSKVETSAMCVHPECKRACDPQDDYCVGCHAHVCKVHVGWDPPMGIHEPEAHWPDDNE